MDAYAGVSWPFVDMTPGHYRALLVDPPWKFKCRTELQMQNWSSRRDVDKHYPTMTIDELCVLPVGKLAARDAHLFLWVTGPCLEQAFEVIQEWGFRYSSVAFTWVKTKKDGGFHTGLGLTTRKNTELCLLARRGNARRCSKAVRELIVAPRREHSRKPDAIYERVEAYCEGPYVELFARRRHPGWVSWGMEIDKF